MELLGPINIQIAALEAELARLGAADEGSRHLTTVTGVGPVTATAFRGHRGRRDAIRGRASSGSLAGADARRMELERDSAPRPHPQGGEWPDALAPGPGRVVHSAPAQAAGDGGAARLGGGDCQPAR